MDKQLPPPLSETTDKKHFRRCFKPPVKKVKYGDHELTLYGLGWLSFLCKKGHSTLRLWESRGILPRPLFAPSGLLRYYTAEELANYAGVINQANVTAGRNKKMDEELIGNQLLAKRELVKQALVNNNPSFKYRFEHEQELIDAMRIKKQKKWRERALKIYDKKQL